LVAAVTPARKVEGAELIAKLKNRLRGDLQIRLRIIGRSLVGFFIEGYLH
jgi:hypothetical protein